MIESFPPSHRARPEQRRILARMAEAVDSGYKNVILCAPTGIGKSHVGIAFARHFGSSSILTAQKILQDQYSADFRFLAVAKGRRNYPCAVRCEERGIDPGGVPAPGTACDDGACWRHGSDGKEWCAYKPVIGDFEVTESGAVIAPPGACRYYADKYSAMLSRHSVYNYHVFFHFRRSKILMDNSAAIVADEAHEIESALAGYCTVSLSPDVLSIAGATAPEAAGSHLESCLSAYDGMLADGERGGRAPGDGTTRERLRWMMSEARRRPDNISVQTTRFAGGDGILVSPVDVSGIGRRIFSAGHQLFMSGTIHPDVFCPSLGLDPRDCAFIEHKTPPFPAEARRTVFLGGPRLGHSAASTEYDAAYAETVRIALKHPDEKGLVLCTSRMQADQIGRLLGSRAVVAYGADREEAVRRHADSRTPTALVSPSLWNGLDLRDGLSRWCVIFKAPFPQLSDARVRERARRSGLWYRYQALIRLIQGCGRSVRHRDDHAVTYIVDSAAVQLLRDMRQYVPAAYADVLCPGGKP